jgi:hypothetical protein
MVQNVIVGRKPLKVGGKILLVGRKSLYLQKKLRL